MDWNCREAHTGFPYLLGQSFQQNTAADTIQSCVARLVGKPSAVSGRLPQPGCAGGVLSPSSRGQRSEAAV